MSSEKMGNIQAGLCDILDLAVRYAQQRNPESGKWIQSGLQLNFSSIVEQQPLQRLSTAAANRDSLVEVNFLASGSLKMFEVSVVAVIKHQELQLQNE